MFHLHLCFAKTVKYTFCVFVGCSEHAVFKITLKVRVSMNNSTTVVFSRVNTVALVLFKSS